MEHTTGECSALARAARSNRTEATYRFEDRVRVTALDGTGSNLRSERIGSVSCWTNLDILCKDHIVYCINKGAAALCRLCRDREIRWVLSLNHPLGHSICLKVTRDVVARELVLRRRPAQPEAIRRIRSLLRICVAGETRALKRWLLMMCSNNGDSWLCCVTGVAASLDAALFS